MYKHLLLATDGSDLADKGVHHGLALAKALGARVSVCTVSEFVPALTLAMRTEVGASISDADIRRAADTAAKKLLDAVSRSAAAEGVPCETTHVFDRLPADAILEVATSRGCDLIVMASHGRRGLPRLLLGSQAFEVVTRATVPVLVVR
jgi:nucleotide-binding universal stress UspA family protein